MCDGVVKAIREAGEHKTCLIVQFANQHPDISFLAFFLLSASSLHTDEDKNKYHILALCLKRRLAIPYQEKAEVIVNDYDWTVEFKLNLRLQFQIQSLIKVVMVTISCLLVSGSDAWSS